MRRVRGLAATEKRQAPFDEGGGHANGVFEHLISVEIHLRAKAHLRFDASDGDLHLDAGGVHVRGQAEGVDAPAVHGLEPDGLPDTGRPRVEDTFGLLLPVLFAPRNGHVTTGVFGPHDQNVLPCFACEGMRDVRGERRVATLVGGYLRTVHPHRRAVVHSAEVEQQTLVAGGRVLEGAGVPDDVVEGRLPDTGELRLVAERHGDLAVERRVTGAQVLQGDTLQAAREPGARIIEGEAPFAVQIDPIPAAELRAWVLGSRHQVTVPFLLEKRAIRSANRDRGAARERCLPQRDS
jgi:hypothetical protein